MLVSQIFGLQKELRKLKSITTKLVKDLKDIKDKMESNQASESSRIYALFIHFFNTIDDGGFWNIILSFFNVLTDEPTDINQLLGKLETGSMGDKANASYRINKLFADFPDKYDVNTVTELLEFIKCQNLNLPLIIL